MIKKILNNSSRSIVGTAILLGITSLISRFLGLYRDRILAGSFGAGDELDVYYAAFRIPDLIYSLLVVGALSAGFIPIFSKYLHKSKIKACGSEAEDEAWYIANGVLNLLIVSIVLICFVFVLFSQELISVIAPGFSYEKKQVCAEMMRWMFLSPVFLGISAVFGGILQSYKKFFVYSLAPILYNLGIIFGAVFFVDFWGLKGLAFGVVLGSFLHLLSQVPVTAWCGWRWRPMFGLKHEGVRKIFGMMLPRVMTLAVSQINFFIITIIASTLAAGSLAIFNFSYNIWSFPLGVFGASFAVAAFPVLSQKAAEEDWQLFKEKIMSTARQVLFFVIPSTVFIIVLKNQIVRVILGTGSFDWNDTKMTIFSLQYFCLGLFAESLILLLARAFFALEDTRTPFFIGLIASAIRFVASYFLAEKMGITGLALGFSIGSIVYLIFLAVFLRKKIGSFGEKYSNMLAILKIIAASLSGGLVSWLSLRPMALLVDMNSGPGILLQGLFAGTAGLFLFFLLSYLLHIEEFMVFWEAFSKKIFLKRRISEVGGFSLNDEK